jgi:hypothetical protein
MDTGLFGFGDDCAALSSAPRTMLGLRTAGKTWGGSSIFAE